MLEKVFWWSAFLAPLPSIALYALTPAGTVQHFNGEPSPTASFWCSVTASGDAYVAWMALMVLLNFHDTKLKKMVLRGNWIYSVLHFGAFWFWHRHGAAHPNPAMYPVALAIATAGLVAWGL